MTKKGTKKSTQPRKNRNFTWKKMSFFTQKRPPSLAKNWNFAWKNHKKMTKKGTKKTTQPRKNWSFVRKKVFFFTQKYHPSSQKTELLSEKKNIFFSFFFSFAFFLFIFLLDFFSFLRFLFKITLKKMKFCMKNLKSSYLWGFWKKKSRPPTSPNF